MRNKSLWLALLLPALCLAAPIRLDFSSEDGVPQGALVEFNGAARTFTFLDAPNGWDFTINYSDDPALVGLKGKLDGTWTIGALTMMAGGLETAPVIGTGTLIISDGANQLVANLTWNAIASFGGIIGLNPDLLPNITNITYSGSNSGLQELFRNSAATGILSLQLPDSPSLSRLLQNGTDRTTYSGLIVSPSQAEEPVPEPSLAWGVALAGAAFAVYSRKRRAA
ncbi:MAG: PEP-CTERM sorting domain-containing protein [Bryobacteraceae bacterium]|nr:PEP-CTERM sorting domain-containing protein [Bryobacteraceae bacterium]